MNPRPFASEPRSACQANAAAVSRRAARESSATANSTPAPDNLCLFCSGPMFAVQCKLICTNCGYREDCSDLFRRS